jgi:hypothetical protein
MGPARSTDRRMTDRSISRGDADLLGVPLPHPLITAAQPLLELGLRLVLLPELPTRPEPLPDVGMLEALEPVSPPLTADDVNEHLASAQSESGTLALGVLTGVDSGVAVLRLDDAAGPAAASLVTAAIGMRAPTVSYPDGVIDLFFAAPSSPFPTRQLGDGITVFGEGGVVPVPPLSIGGCEVPWDSPLPEAFPQLPWTLQELERESHVKSLRAVSQSTSGPGVEADLICLKDVEPGRVEWLVQDRIPRGELTVIAGRGGLGKTMVTHALAAAISGGAPGPLSGEPLPRGGVLRIGTEDHLANTVRPRLEAAGADLARVYALQEVVAFGRRQPLVLPRHAEVLERLIEDYEIELVVIDPVTDLLGGLSGNSEEDVRSALMPLARIAQKTGCAVVLVRHVTKGSNGGVGSVLGSVAWANVPRAALEAIETANGGRAMRVVKHNLVPPGVPDLTFEIETVEGPTGPAPRIRWLGEAEPEVASKPPTAMENATAFILDLLADGPVLGSEVKAAAAKEAGFSPGTLDKAKAALGVESHPRGGRWATWHLPEHHPNTASPKGGQDDGMMSDPAGD